ncbi:MAG: DNA replication terminus site-binding family protein [Pseudomonadota bacterium]
MLSPDTLSSLYEAFDALLDGVVWAQNHVLADQGLPAWVDGLEPSSALSDDAGARHKTADMLAALEYHNDQAPKEAIICPGFVGASEETLARIATLNDAKLAFKAIMVALRDEQVVNPQQSQYIHQKILESLRERPKGLTKTLKHLGLGRLNLKQCYRLVTILPYPLLKIRWTWANTRAITRITVEEAGHRLMRRGEDPGIVYQRARLSALSPNEPLAIVQELAPHLRANIHMRLPDGSVERRMIKCHLPVFYPCAHGSLPPDFQPVKEKQGRDVKRIIRADTRLAPEPFLPAIRAHRYLDPAQAIRDMQAEHEKKSEKTVETEDE